MIPTLFLTDNIRDLCFATFTSSSALSVCWRSVYSQIWINHLESLELQMFWSLLLICGFSDQVQENVPEAIKQIRNNKRCLVEFCNQGFIGKCWAFPWLVSVSNIGCRTESWILDQTHVFYCFLSFTHVIFAFCDTFNICILICLNRVRFNCNTNEH